MLCVDYAPIYKVQRKKSTIALMDRDNVKMFTTLFTSSTITICELMTSSIVGDINGA